MKQKLQAALRKFRLANPQVTLGMNDEEVLELMMLVATQEDNSGIGLSGRGDDGRLIFSIDLADGSDGSG